MHMYRQEPSPPPQPRVAAYTHMQSIHHTMPAPLLRVPCGQYQSLLSHLSSRGAVQSASVLIKPLESSDAREIAILQPVVGVVVVFFVSVAAGVGIPSKASARTIIGILVRCRISHILSNDTVICGKEFGPQIIIIKKNICLTGLFHES